MAVLYLFRTVRVLNRAWYQYCSCRTAYTIE